MIVSEVCASDCNWAPVGGTPRLKLKRSIASWWCICAIGHPDLRVWPWTYNEIVYTKLTEGNATSEVL